VRNRSVARCRDQRGGGEETGIRVKEPTHGGCIGVRPWMRGHLTIVGVRPGD
jgi:hypothetical protein